MLKFLIFYAQFAFADTHLKLLSHHLAYLCFWLLYKVHINSLDIQFLADHHQMFTLEIFFYSLSSVIKSLPTILQSIWMKIVSHRFWQINLMWHMMKIYFIYLLHFINIIEVFSDSKSKPWAEFLSSIIFSINFGSVVSILSSHYISPGIFPSYYNRRFLFYLNFILYRVDFTWWIQREKLNLVRILLFH